MQGFLILMASIVAFIIVVLTYGKIRDSRKSKKFQEENDAYGIIRVLGTKGMQTDFIQSISVNNEKSVGEADGRSIKYYMTPGDKSIEVMLTHKDKYNKGRFIRRTEHFNMMVEKDIEYLLTYNFETEVFHVETI